MSLDVSSESQELLFAGKEQHEQSFTVFVVTALNSVLGNESVRSKDKGLTLVFQNPTSLMGIVGDDLTTNLPVHWHI